MSRDAVLTDLAALRLEARSPSPPVSFVLLVYFLLLPMSTMTSAHLFSLSLTALKKNFD